MGIWNFLWWEQKDSETKAKRFNCRCCRLCQYWLHVSKQTFLKFYKLRQSGWYRTLPYILHSVSCSIYVLACRIYYCRFNGKLNMCVSGWVTYMNGLCETSKNATSLEREEKKERKRQGDSEWQTDRHADRASSIISNIHEMRTNHLVCTMAPVDDDDYCINVRWRCGTTISSSLRFHVLITLWLSFSQNYGNRGMSELEREDF